MQYTIEYERSLVPSSEYSVRLIHKRNKARKDGNVREFEQLNQQIDDYVRVFTPYIPSVEWTSVLHKDLMAASSVHIARLVDQVCHLLLTDPITCDMHKLRRDLCIIRSARYMETITIKDWEQGVKSIHVELRNKQAKLDAIREFAPKLCASLERIKYTITSNGDIHLIAMQELQHMDTIRKDINNMIVQDCKGMMYKQIDVLSRNFLWVDFLYARSKITRTPPGFK